MGIVDALRRTSEEHTDRFDQARCWIDPGIWKALRTKRNLLRQALSQDSLIWERVAANWPYLPGKEKKIASVFRDSARIDLTEDGMIELTVDYKKLPKSNYKGSNYAALMMDNVLYSLQQIIEDTIKGDMGSGDYLMFYRFDPSCFAKETPWEPAFNPSLHLPKYIRPHDSIDIHL